MSTPRKPTQSPRARRKMIVQPTHRRMHRPLRTATLEPLAAPDVRGGDAGENGPAASLHVAWELALTGKRLRQCLEVLFRGQSRWLQPAIYTALVDLIVAADSETADGYLRLSSISQSQGNESYGRTLVSRLNQQIGATITETSCGDVRLMRPHLITIRPLVFHLRAGLIAPQLLEALRRTKYATMSQACDTSVVSE